MAKQRDDGLVLMREIDEDLKQERYLILWKKYKILLIALLLLVTGGVVAGLQWQKQNIAAREEGVLRLMEALRQIEIGEIEAATPVFSDIAINADLDYAFLARFQQAGMMAEEGSFSKAAELYYDLSSDETIDPIYRELALILGTVQDLNVKENHMRLFPLSEMNDRLMPLSQELSAWRFSARELMALIALEQGDREKAHSLLEALITDTDTPPEMRRRAQGLRSETGSP